MGEVNLAAIGEYEDLSTRFQFMNQQKEDLEKSIADLQRTIIKLNRICRLRFKESLKRSTKIPVNIPSALQGRQGQAGSYG